MDQEKIAKIVQENKDIIYQRDFFEMLKSTSLLEFRKNINFIQGIFPTLYLENKVQEYYQELLGEFQPQSDLFLVYEKILEHFSENDFEFLESYQDFSYFVEEEMMIQLQDYYHYRDGLELAREYLKKVSREKISEIVVDGLFQDTIYNVWINIREMLRYQKGLNPHERLLSEEKIHFYQSILDIDQMSNLDKIKMYEDLKDKRIALEFYQDWWKVKKHSYQRIKKCLFRVKEKNNLFHYKESLQYHVPIYQLNGEDFFMLVSCRKAYSDTSSARRHCYSLISSYNMEVFTKNKNKFIYGYTDFPIESILHVFEDDIASTSNFGENSFTTSFVNRIMTPSQISYSNGYSEIQIVNKKSDKNQGQFEVRKPNYLVVFDQIEERHLIEAKRLHIPIVMISTSKYLSKIRENKKNNCDLGYERFQTILDSYTNGSGLEGAKRSRR